jgi:hydroxymethylpyrimidine/phosphomethylpyrimidine kinase
MSRTNLPPPSEFSASGRTVCALGGLDPTCGAGLLRDFSILEALGARAVCVASALTQQDVHGVRGFSARPVSDVISDLDVLAKGRAAALKIGMVGTAALARALCDSLRDWPPRPIVFDPVLGASAGGGLYANPLETLHPLIAQVTLLTPNRAEARRIAATLGRDIDRPAAEGAAKAETEAEQDEGEQDEAERLGAAILQLGCRAVLIKGGHFGGLSSVDTLVTKEGSTPLSSPRLPGGHHVRGTGCMLSTAIACALASRAPMLEAVRLGKAVVTPRIAKKLESERDAKDPQG